MTTDSFTDVNSTQVHQFASQMANLGFARMTETLLSILDSGIWQGFTDGIGTYPFLPGEFDYFLTQQGVARDHVMRGVTDINAKARLEAAMDERRTGEDGYRRRLADVRQQIPQRPGRPVEAFGPAEADSAAVHVNGHLVDDLSGVARHGGSALADGPAVLRRVLEAGAWREFMTQRNERVQHRRFSEFVTARPLRGLGADMDVIRRIAGSEDPDLLRQLRNAEKVGKPGPPAAGEIRSESEPISGETSSYTAERLARDHPEQYEQVKAGALSINAAAVQTGIRPKRASITGRSTGSAAKTIVRQFGHDYARGLVDDLIRELQATAAEEPDPPAPSPPPPPSEVETNP